MKKIEQFKEKSNDILAYIDSNKEEFGKLLASSEAILNQNDIYNNLKVLSEKVVKYSTASETDSFKGRKISHIISLKRARDIVNTQSDTYMSDDEAGAGPIVQEIADKYKEISKAGLKKAAMMLMEDELVEVGKLSAKGKTDFAKSLDNKIDDLLKIVRGEMKAMAADSGKAQLN